MKRDILAIHGSPRPGGFSSQMMKSFIDPFRTSAFRVHEISISELSINSCTACGSCRNEFTCIFDDDMTPLYPLLRDAALVSIATPIYFSGIPGPLKILIDRCQVLWELDLRNPDKILPKEVFMLAAAGSDFSGTFEGAFLTLRHFFNTIGGILNRDNIFYLPDTDCLEDLTGDTQGQLSQKGVEVLKRLRENS